MDIVPVIARVNRSIPYRVLAHRKVFHTIRQKSQLEGNQIRLNQDLP